MHSSECLRVTAKDIQFSQLGPLTLSIGFVRASSRLSATALLGQADQALYYVKQQGKNPVVSYEHILAEGLISKPAAIPAGAIELF